MQESTAARFEAQRNEFRDLDAIARQLGKVRVRLQCRTIDAGEQGMTEALVAVSVERRNALFATVQTVIDGVAVEKTPIDVATDCLESIFR